MLGVRFAHVGCFRVCDQSITDAAAFSVLKPLAINAVLGHYPAASRAAMLRYNRRRTVSRFPMLTNLEVE